MNYLDLINRLTACGAVAPSHEAAEIVRVLAGKPREWILLHRDEELPPEVEAAAARRELGIPLQYILGEAWFCGNRFEVSPDCLIPQPDTEHCVELALRFLKNGSSFLDLCTGSGCIAISILKEKPSISGIAVDISPAALGIATRNAALHKVCDRLAFRKCDVLRDDLSELVANADVIVSNPPYIETDVIDTLSREVQNEPRIALDGGRDGLAFYRHFILNLPKHMKPDAVMLLEIGYDQSEKITELCHRAGLNLRLHRDFGGNLRVAEIRRVNIPDSE